MAAWLSVKGTCRWFGLASTAQQPKVNRSCNCYCRMLYKGYISAAWCQIMNCSGPICGDVSWAGSI